MDSRGRITAVPGGDSFLGDSGPTDVSLLSAVLPYVFMIIVCPIGIFFTSKSYFFENVLGYTEMSSSVYAAICSVVVLHVLLGLFILKSFRYESPKSGKQD